MHVSRQEKEGKTNFGSTGFTVDLTPYDVGIQGLLGTIDGAMDCVRILQYLTNLAIYQRQLLDGWLDQVTFDKYMAGYQYEKTMVEALRKAQAEAAKNGKLSNKEKTLDQVIKELVELRAGLNKL